MRRSRLAVGGMMAAGLVACGASAASAHPLGNDTIEHFSVLYLYSDRMEIDFLIDVAEIPSARIRQDEIDADGDGQDTAEEQKAWLERQVRLFVPSLIVHLDGRLVPVHPVETGGRPSNSATQAATVPKRLIMKMPGFANMPTYRIICRYAAALPNVADGRKHVLTYSDATYPRDRGLKRVIFGPPPEGLTVHEKDRVFLDEGPDPFLYELYDPSNLPQERTGRIVFSVPAVIASPSAKQPLDSFLDPRNNPALASKYGQQVTRISGLLQTGLSLKVLALIGILCFGYGAWHALLPGHAKTIVAAYLISLRGTYWHALMLALVVTITHSALVIVVGLVFLIARPDAASRVQLWLGLTAGVMIAAMGAWLVFRAMTGRLHRHSHAEHDHGHENEAAHADTSEIAPRWPATLRAWLKMLFVHTHPHPHSHSHHDHVHRHAAHRGRHDHEHDIGHPHNHALAHNHHEPGEPAAGPGQTTHAETRADPAHGLLADGTPRLTMRLVVWLGISGGIVPCPAATWMMLAAIAQNQPAAGLYAVGFFSLGLALALMVIGFMALSSRRFASRLMGESQSRWWLLTLLPTAGGSIVTALGCAIAAHYVWLLMGNTPLFRWLEP